MTSHELALKLLALPNVPVGFYEYNGGWEPWNEVKTVGTNVHPEDADGAGGIYKPGECIVLSTTPSSQG